MEIRYCDKCTLRISQAEIDAGLVEQADGRMLCAKCCPPISSTAIAIKPATPSHSTPSGVIRHSKKEAAIPAQSNTGLIVGAAAGVILLLGIVFLVSGKSEPE